MLFSAASAVYFGREAARVKSVALALFDGGVAIFASACFYEIGREEWSLYILRNKVKRAELNQALENLTSRDVPSESKLGAEG